MENERSDNSYASKEDAERYLNTADRPAIPESVLKHAEDKIDENYTFVDEEGWPVHIAEKDFKP